MSERRASMGDKVYRGDVIKFIRNNITLSTFMKRTVKTADEACWDLCDKLNYVPAINEEQHEQHWIPVTDKEPNLYKRVIVTWEYGSKRYTAEASRQERNGTTFYKAESPNLFRYNPLKVVAWQEKPEPWEGDAE